MAPQPVHEPRALEPEAGPSGLSLPEAGSLAHVLQTVRGIMQTMLQAKDEAELLQRLCSDIIAGGCFRQVGIALAAGEDGKRIHWAAWLGADGDAVVPVDLGPLNALQLSIDDVCASGSAVAVAMRTRRPCVRQPLFSCATLGEEIRYLQERARDADFNDITALPMMNGSELIGALFVAAPGLNCVEDDAVSLLASIADDLAHGIIVARLRAHHAAAQRTIERMAFYDTLTGLPNRTLYLIRLQEAIDRAGIDGSPLVVLHIKLAKLTEICEVLGFGASEYLVSEMATRLKRHTSPDHALSRIADGNFALFLFEELASARELAGLLARKCEEAIEFEGITVDMSLEIGIAQHHACIRSASEINRRAESALRHGAGNIKSYIGAKDRENASALALVSDLQHTIRKNGLALHFQPKVDLRTRTVVGAEALVRWRHPTQGDIAPSRFIPLAERSNMISQITSWILGAVHAQLKAWQKSGFRWPVAINLSAHDLYNQALMESIAEFAAGIDPSLVQFELTESVLIDDPLSARRSLERLSELGFALAIDDFGTGFAGLSYLQNFPFDYIKIDQSFVMPMLDNASADAIVRSTIDLGHQLGRKVIAEGVEDNAVWTRLQAYGCDIAQGYLISKPLAAADFGDWARRWASRATLVEAEFGFVP